MHASDPIGKAIQRFKESQNDFRIRVESDLMEDDVMPVPYLFRSYDIMPELEKYALAESKGKVLDVGAGAGPHTSYLRNKGFDVTAIDTSKGAIDYLNEVFPNDENLNTTIDGLLNEGRKFDTVILLMNGIGLAGDLDNLEGFLLKLKDLLSDNGKILCDSTDVRYFYEADDGGMWVDLNTHYHGNFKFRLHFEDESSEWFKWVYVDAQTFEKIAESIGFSFNVIFTKEHAYLAELKRKK